MTDLDALRAEAFAELEIEKPVEAIKGQIIDNTETIKKIEESRIFVSAEKQESKTNNWFKSATQSSSSTQSSTQAKVSSTPYQNSYGYQYQTPYTQKVETLENKAHDVTNKLFKDLGDRAKVRVSKEKKKNVSNWTMLQTQDSKELSKREGNKVKKVITRTQARRRILFYQMAITAMRAFMESLFISVRERK